MTPLRQKMINDMIVRRLAPKTQKAYISAVAGLSRFYNKTPDKINNEQIQDYLLYLLKDKKLAWSSCNVIINGLRFFYTQTLHYDSTSFTLPPCKRQKHLPEILSPEEINKLFKAATSLRQRTLLMTTYSAGLRVSEVVNLKITDIDSRRKTIRVYQSKGNKDRYTLLSDKLVEELRIVASHIILVKNGSFFSHFTELKLIFDEKPFHILLKGFLSKMNEKTPNFAVRSI